MRVFMFLDDEFPKRTLNSFSHHRQGHARQVWINIKLITREFSLVKVKMIHGYECIYKVHSKK